MLATSMTSACAVTHSMPQISVARLPPPPESSTRTAQTRAPGATPTTPTRVVLGGRDPRDVGAVPPAVVVGVTAEQSLHAVDATGDVEVGVVDVDARVQDRDVGVDAGPGAVARLRRTQVGLDPVDAGGHALRRLAVDLIGRHHLHSRVGCDDRGQGRAHPGGVGADRREQAGHPHARPLVLGGDRGRRAGPQHHDVRIGDHGTEAAGSGPATGCAPAAGTPATSRSSAAPAPVRRTRARKEPAGPPGQQPICAIGTPPPVR